MDQKLLLIRGLPGAGKSTRASHELWSVPDQRSDHCEADHFFLNWDGRYRFDPAKIGEAHMACQIHCLAAMRRGTTLITVANTFSQKWEMVLYVELAKAFGYIVGIIDLFDAGLTDEQLAARCRHGVPVEVIAKMRARWEK